MGRDGGAASVKLARGVGDSLDPRVVQQRRAVGLGRAIGRRAERGIAHHADAGTLAVLQHLRLRQVRVDLDLVDSRDDLHVDGGSPVILPHHALFLSFLYKGSLRTTENDSAE